jgi:hypothetical protein
VSRRSYVYPDWDNEPEMVQWWEFHAQTKDRIDFTLGIPLDMSRGSKANDPWNSMTRDVYFDLQGSELSRDRYTQAVKKAVEGARQEATVAPGYETSLAQRLAAKLVEVGMTSWRGVSTDRFLDPELAPYMKNTTMSCPEFEELTDILVAGLNAEFDKVPQSWDSFAASARWASKGLGMNRVASDWQDYGRGDADAWVLSADGYDLHVLKIPWNDAYLDVAGNDGPAPDSSADEPHAFGWWVTAPGEAPQEEPWGVLPNRADAMNEAEDNGRYGGPWHWSSRTVCSRCRVRLSHVDPGLPAICDRCYSGPTTMAKQAGVWEKIDGPEDEDPLSEFELEYDEYWQFEEGSVDAYVGLMDGTWEWGVDADTAILSDLLSPGGTRADAFAAVSEALKSVGIEPPPIPS